MRKETAIMFRNESTARFRALLLGAALCALFAAAPPARAAAVQLDSGNHDIFQDGRKVGEIFVPAREPGATFYVEHWVLFADYIYPNRQLSVVTTIKASRLHYASEEEFFARVAWGPGYRYVRVESYDTDQLPGK
jgi:hypothetical protein